MLAELACIIELECIVYLTEGLVKEHLALACRPVYTVVIIELSTLVSLIFVLDCTGKRIYPHLLGIIVEVVYTAASLNKCVVERQTALHMQTLGDEVKVLTKNEVRIDLGGGALLHTVGCDIESRVRHVSLTRSIVAPHAVAIDGAHGCRGGLIGCVPVT